MSLLRSGRVIAALALAGCGLFTSFDDLSGGADAGTPDVDGGPVGNGDAGGVPTNEGGAAADAGRFCASSDAAFCEDWDEDKGERWLQSEIINGAVVVDTDAATSGATSLLATSEPLAAGEEGFAYRAIELQERVTGWRLSFDLRIEQRGDSAFVATQLTMKDLGDGSLYHVTLVLSADIDALDESIELADGGFPYSSWGLGARIPIGRWTRMTIEVVRTAGGGRHARVWSDAMLLLDRDLSRGGGFFGGRMRLVHGLAFLRGPAPKPWAVRYDSTTLDPR